MSPAHTLPQALIRSSEAHGDKPAFLGPGWSKTYNELETRSRRLATRLAGAGGGRGDFVAIVLDRCYEAVESVYAITRAGAVGVPLDSRSPISELKTALEHCGARLIITDERHLTTVRAAATKGSLILLVTKRTLNETINGDFRVVCYEDWATATLNELGSNPEIDTLEAHEPAYLHYTSGTTSLPKGVLSSQNNHICNVDQVGSVYGLTSEDRWLWPLPLFHCLGHSLCVIATVVVGASAYLTPIEKSPLNSFSDSYVRDVTIIAGAPATFHELTRTMSSTSSIANDIPVVARSLPRLRACMYAGAVAPVTLRAQVQDLFGVPLTDNYGCTEACGAIATDPPDGKVREHGSVKPLPGWEYKIIDQDGNEVKGGEQGELLIRGPSLMLGYYKEPLSPFTEEGWFPTGDIAVCSNSAGDITVAGRKRELIIRGGENINPVELERILLRHPSVADVVVAAAAHRILGEVPAAYIVKAEKGSELDLSALLALCREALPDYKVPISFYEIDAVPQTLLGKPKRLSVASITSRPLTFRSKLLTKHDIKALVRTETAWTCALDMGEDDANQDWLRENFEQPFSLIGISSMIGVVLRDRLASLTGLSNLPTTLVYDHPTPAAVSDYLCSRLLPEKRRSRQVAQNEEPIAQAEPIAIISMACRYPGGISSPEDLWQLVVDEVDATTDFPRDRGWDIDTLYSTDPDAPGTSTTKRGGFLPDFADFDAGLFGMAPREALATDPQQRLLLETTWELAERGGIAPLSLKGSQTGAYIGTLYDDYEDNGIGNDELEAHLGLGSSGSVLSGRISYCFGLHGPSVAVTTGCSSSLVAVHQAAQGLRNRECTLAIAGGVTTMSTPRPFTMFSKRRGLSSDGRCRAYSSDASGTGWSEGIGLIMLERLSDAKRNGHKVISLIRGSAINSDGASNGLTAPNGVAQQMCIQSALAYAGLQREDVDVLEGHGTATPLGDPIEAQAVVDAYGNGDGSDGRPPRPQLLLLGSIKSNLGHTQAAAAVAGIIKMAQALQFGVAPASLHIREPSHRIEWDGSGVELLSKARKWPKVNRPRRAAVSSFGIGGTNGHIILEQPELVDEPEYRQIPPRISSVAFPWAITGASEAALRAQAKSLLVAWEEAGEAKRTTDMAFSLATARSALKYRATINYAAGTNARAQIHSALESLSEGKVHPDVVEGRKNTVGTDPRVAFMFSGQGSRLPTLSTLEELFALFPVFSEAFQEACEAVDYQLENPVTEAFAEGGSKLERPDYAQAALFVFEVAMFRLLESFNICPDVVIGHSLGEIAAAHVSGALSLRDAAYIVTTRARLIAALPATGGMVSISATRDEISHELSQMGSTAVIAVVNSPSSVVVSGSQEAIQLVAQRFTHLGKRATVLRNVNHGFHSPIMDGVLPDLKEALSTTLSASTKDNGAQATIPLISTVTGKLAGAAQLNSWEHWTRHVREPVCFMEAVSQLQTTEGVTVIVEVGPSAILCPHVPDAVASHSNLGKLLNTVGRLWTQGVSVDWRAVFQSSGARLVDLPVYAFQRQKFWLPYSPLLPKALMQGSGAHSHIQNTVISGKGQSMLSEATSVAGTDIIICSGYLSTVRQPWLRDHVISGQWLVPATAMMEMALCAAYECAEFVQPESTVLDDMIVAAPMILPPVDGEDSNDQESEELEIQVIIGEPGSHGDEGAPFRSVDVYSRPRGVAAHVEWTRHATGSIKFNSTSGQEIADDINASITMESSEVDVAQSYAMLDGVGISYGPNFQTVRSIWRVDGDNDILVQIDSPADKGQNPSIMIHPAILDGALHAPILASPDKLGGDDLMLPFSMCGVQVFEATTSTGPVLARIRRVDEERLSVILKDKATGALMAQIREVQLRRWQTPVAGGDLYRLEWTEFEATITPSPSTNDRIVRIQGSRGVAPENLIQFVYSSVAETLRVVQEWKTADKARQSADHGSRLVFVSERATSTTSDDNNHVDLATAAVWGFVRSVQAEIGGDRVALVDVDGSEISEDAVATALASKEEVVAIRNGKTMSAALKVYKEPHILPHALDKNAINVSGTVLITGGTGGLGAMLSRYLIKTHGAQSLLLVSRRGIEAPGASELRDELTVNNATVRVETCDVSDRIQLAALLERQDPQTPLTTIIHCAGVVDDGLVVSQTPDRISRVLRSKVDAAWNLHELAPDTVHSFVLFSSYVGTVGNEGQAGYTAANAFLDALARLRVAKGLPAVSIAWGPWANDEGMAAESKLVPNQRVANAQPFTDQQGLHLFTRAAALQTTTREPVVVPLLLRGLFPMVQSTRKTTAKKQMAKNNSASTIGGGASWRNTLAEVSAENRHDALLGLVRNEVAAVLGYQGEDLPDRPLPDLGFDSFTSILLSNRMGVLAGCGHLPVTLALDHDTTQALTQYMLKRMETDSEPLESLESHEFNEDVDHSSSDVNSSSDNNINTPSHCSNESLPRGKDKNDNDIDPMDFRGLSNLHRRLCKMEKFTAAADLLATAALAMPTFSKTASSLSNYAEPPHRLATGPSGDFMASVPIPVVFIAPFFPRIKIAGANLSVYSALAAAINGARDLFELPHPEGPSVPKDLDTLATLHVETIRKQFADRPGVILAGYSAGGTVAYAVASKLAKSLGDGPRLAGFVLVDTYLTMTGRGDPDWLNALPADALVSRLGGRPGNEGDSPVGDLDLALAKVGGYFLTLRDWDIELYDLPESLPTLFVRAQDPSGKMPKDPEIWKPRWSRANTTKEVPGSHLALLDRRYAPAIAVEIERWAQELIDRNENRINGLDCHHTVKE